MKKIVFFAVITVFYLTSWAALSNNEIVNIDTYDNIGYLFWAVVTTGCLVLAGAYVHVNPKIAMCLFWGAALYPGLACQMDDIMLLFGVGLMVAWLVFIVDKKNACYIIRSLKSLSKTA